MHALNKISLTVVLSIFVAGSANADYAGSILGNKDDIKKGLDLNNKKGKKPLKEAGYSPYAGTNYPTKVLWGDTHVHTNLSLDASVSAFYYARVLQIPTPRHTLFDTIALNVDPKESGNPATIQERAYTSPIWYTPN